LSGGHGVRGAGARRRVDAQHLAEEGLERLAVPARRVARADVARRAPVAEPDVEIALGPEPELSAVVVGLGLVDLEHVPAARRVRHPALHGELVDLRVAVGVGVVDVELGAIGRERETEQPALAAVLAHPAAEVDDGRGGDGAVADGPHDTTLLSDVERARPRARGHGGGAAEIDDARELESRGPSRAGRRRRSGGQEEGGHARDDEPAHDLGTVPADCLARTSRTLVR